jgi:hypothetical protein
MLVALFSQCATEKAPAEAPIRFTFAITTAMHKGAGGGAWSSHWPQRKSWRWPAAGDFDEKFASHLRPDWDSARCPG